MNKLNVYMTTQSPPSPPHDDDEDLTPEEATERDLEYIEEG